MNPFPAMSSNNPVAQILFNHPQNAVLAGGDLSTADSIDVSVVATQGDFQYRIDILDLGIVLSTAITRLLATGEPGRQNGIATIRYTQSVAPTIIRSFGEDIDESDSNSDISFGSTDEQIEITTDSVYDAVSNQPLGPNDLRHILRQPPTRTVTTTTRTTKRGGRRNKKRKHR
ncbi:hypothetical protein HK102_002936 [Quaeritorhiza haematococci]|nr:hypothetical protein HK102_002936 [Quaeritorhiza haematococci]